MGICHYCFNCGRCRGEKPKPIVFSTCLACGHVNPEGVTECQQCGASLVLEPGVTNTAGVKAGAVVHDPKSCRSEGSSSR